MSKTSPTPRQEFYLTMGERLKLLREAHGYTLQQVASGIGIALKAYSGYETGAGSICCYVASRIARFYNCGITSIIPPQQESS